VGLTGRLPRVRELLQAVLPCLFNGGHLPLIAMRARSDGPQTGYTIPGVAMIRAYSAPSSVGSVAQGGTR